MLEGLVTRRDLAGIVTGDAAALTERARIWLDEVDGHRWAGTARMVLSERLERMGMLADRLAADTIPTEHGIDRLFTEILETERDLERWQRWIANDQQQRQGR